MNVLILDCGEGIKGECLREGYVNKIDVLSYSHGIAQPITGDPDKPKRTAGKPNHQDFTVTKHFDLSSCFLTQYCNTATVIPTVRLTVGEAEDQKVNPLITYQLSNALVSSISVGGAGGDGKPQETVTFNYTKIQWDYTGEKAPLAGNGPQPQNNPSNPSANLVPDVAKGQAKWNLETNKAE